jgi:uncharacterized protein
MIDRPDQRDRPVPVPDELSAPFWAAAARGELALARCSTCSQFSFPAEAVCPRCGSPEPDWIFAPVSGRGVVRSWTIVHQAFLPGIDVPFVLVDVELADQADLRLIGRLVDGAEANLGLGAEVVTEFERLGDELGLPVFRLAAS